MAAAAPKARSLCARGRLRGDARVRPHRLGAPAARLPRETDRSREGFLKMGGSVDGPTNVQQKTESSATNPWLPAVPALNRILGQASGLGTDVTDAQRAA